MVGRLRTGKVPWELIGDLLTDELPPEVRLGPACGEDAALVELGGELWAVASDPISFTARDAGRLAVTVNSNDIAVRGARPRFLTAVVLLGGDDATGDRARELIAQIRDTCRANRIALVGGHTEVAPGLPHSLVIATLLGRVEGRPVTTAALQPGDRLGLVRWAGLEGTAILRDELRERLDELDGAAAYADLDGALAGDWLSVVEPALAAAAVPGVHSLHDVTEGGVGEALHEVAAAAGLALEIEREAIPVRPATRAICDRLGVDPLGLIGSGGLLVGCASAATAEVEAAMARLDVPLSWIGRAGGRGEPRTGLPRFPRDELLAALAGRGAKAVVFDMDGTLVDSSYDWPAIRSRLGVTAASIIDQLNGLAEPERSRRWAELEAIEREASAAAGPKPGAAELLDLLVARRVPAALVTNNTDANTHALLGRLELAFDVVLTRDSGLWKPSGAPVAEAIRRLGASPATTLAVGDSHYDVEAARAAGCGWVCVVHDRDGRHRDDADLHLPDLEALRRHLEVVL